MAIFKQTKSPTQTDISYHAVHKVEMGGDFTTLKLYVRSYVNDDLLTNGGGDVPLAWMWELSMMADPNQIMTLPTIENMLITDHSSPFYQGVLVEQLSDEQRARNVAWERIKTERDRRKYAGVKVGEHWFHSDDTSRIQQIALSMMGAGMPAGIMWKTMAGDFVEMSPELANQIFAAVAANDQAIFSVAEQHKQAMQASSEPWLYDFSTGWPQTFEEYTAMLN